MGVVYLAVDTVLDRHVALKVIRPGLSLKSQSIEKFKREARAAAALSHPNIVHINSLEEIDGQLIIEMPYLTGGSLRDYLTKGLSTEAAVQILHSLLTALACCHGAGIVHRDVKPSNILFNDKHVPMLGDFGTATLMGDEFQQSSQDGATVSFAGTPRYSCPEAWNGDPLSPSWDLYAVGIMAWEMFATELPFGELSPLAFMRKMAENPIPSIASEGLHISTELTTFIDALCAHDAADRPASAEDALLLLSKAPESECPRGNETISLPVRSPKRRTIATTYLAPWLTKTARVLPWTLVVILTTLLVWRLATGEARSLQTSATETSVAQTPLRQTQSVGRQHVIPSTTELGSWLRGPEPDSSVVYDLRASNDSRVVEQLVVYPANTDRSPRMVGKIGPYLVSLNLTSTGEKMYGITGTWGGYVGEDMHQLVHGALEGSVEWSGHIDAPLWISLGYQGSDIPEGFSQVLMGGPTFSDTTDTALLVALEDDPVAMPVLFRDLNQWHPESAHNTFQLLPAMEGMTLDAPMLDTQSRIVVDGQLDEPAWSRSKRVWTTGIPGDVAAEAAILADSTQLYMALQLPSRDPATLQTQIAILPLYNIPQSDSPYWVATIRENDAEAVWVAGESRTPVSTLEPFAAESDGHGTTLELSIPLAAMQVEVPVRVGEKYRVNIHVEDLAGNSIVQWGWPILSEVNHGAIVNFTTPIDEAL